MNEIVSIVVPVHNEEQVLAELYRRLTSQMAGIGYSYEVIFVDDGSRDATLEIVTGFCESDKSIVVIELSRNFGKEAAVSAGLDVAIGDAVIVIDADLQDPPELISEFLSAWREGYDVVYGVRRTRDGDTWLKRKSASAFYRLLNSLSDVEIPENAGDFRLLSRMAVDALKSMNERHRYMKGLFAWVGYRQKAIFYDRDSRFAGETKWSYWQLWTLALEGLTSFTDVPLKLATYLGVFTSGLSFLYGIYFLFRTLIFGNPIPGYPSLILVVLFLGGVQLICLGILGEYLARTYSESKQRPLYLVRSMTSNRHRGHIDSEGQAHNEN
ncbi:MAG: glycosyltransferase family 2 protein [Halioglobus sp.]